MIPSERLALQRALAFLGHSIVALVLLSMLSLLIYLIYDDINTARQRPVEGVVREAVFSVEHGNWLLVIVSEDGKRSRIINLSGDYATWVQYPVGSYYKKVDNVE